MSSNERLLLVALVLLVYGLFCLWFARGYFRRGGLVAASDTLVAYASQTGTALALARQMLAVLPANTRLLPLNQVDDKVLSSARRALIIASTYGDGEAPDNGARFAQRCVTGKPLANLEFAVLAIGDSSYPRYCRFGRSLHQGLLERGAQPLSQPVELDASQQEATASALERWHSLFRTLDDAAKIEPLQSEAASLRQLWVMKQRTLLNPGSPGGPLFLVQFIPAEGQACDWQAGDIVDVTPTNDRSRCRQVLTQLGLNPKTQSIDPNRLMSFEDALVSRELPDVPPTLSRFDDETIDQWITQLPIIQSRKYSIASIATGGTLDLVIRQQRDENGRLGLASGWLTRQIEIDDSVSIQIHSNPLFRSPEPEVPLLLIGNGSGIAGLRAHLYRRREHGAKRNWLIFGERDPKADRLFADEINAWLESATLERLNLVFSRCPRRPMYVQDALYKNEDNVEAWVSSGAAIMVCGSRQGMAQDVDKALTDIVGRDVLDELEAAGRYLRDVY
jgi:sulfite reductase (NADPH) flavoprotein alpha-component